MEHRPLDNVAPVTFRGERQTTAIGARPFSFQPEGDQGMACSSAMPAVAAPDMRSIGRQLERMRNSVIFSRCMRLFALLEFLVAETLEGRGGTLKELVIGEALYSRAGAYDPGIDSSVRVEVRRLRRKLKEYYEGPGCKASIQISLPQSGYCPAFISKRPPTHNPCETRNRSASPGADLAVIPFRALTANRRHGEFADGLTDELTYVLEQEAGLNLLSRLIAFQFRNRCYEVHEAAATGARLFLHGTLRFAGHTVRVMPELSDPRGLILWSARVDFPASDDFGEQEQLARHILSLIPVGILGASASPETRAVKC